MIMFKGNYRIIVGSVIISSIVTYLVSNSEILPFV